MSEQATFPIRHIAEVTGVLTVTLRAWERRYGLLKPQRTEKGHRLYSMADIQRVQQVLALLEQGVAISQVRLMLDQKQAPSSQLPTQGGLEALQASLQQAALSLDSLAVSQVIYDAGATYPLSLLDERLIRPTRHRLQQGSATIAWAVRVAALSALNAGLSLAMLRRKAHLGSKRLTGSFLFAGFGDEVGCISYEIAQVAAAEAGLQAYAVGFEVPLPALAEAAAYRAAGGIVLWADLEPAPGWEQMLAQLRSATKLPLFLGGELAARHANALKNMAIKALPLAVDVAMQQLKHSLRSDDAVDTGGADVGSNEVGGGDYRE